MTGIVGSNYNGHSKIVLTLCRAMNEKPDQQADGSGGWCRYPAPITVAFLRNGNCFWDREIAFRLLAHTTRRSR